MRKFLLAASAVALIAACTGAANADAENGRHGGGRGAHMLFMADANNDGTVTRQEFDAGRSAMFARIDANNDGNATREEGRAAWQAMRAEHREQRSERGEQRAHERDANNDGALSRDEFLAGPSERFAQLDANHDGQLSADERPERGEHGWRGRGHGGRGGGMHDADANNDGTISRAEFDASGVALFQRLDGNNDGQVTRAEAEAAHPPRGPAPN